MSPKKIIIIGSGISGLSAACYLAKAGYDVTILEKNTQAGGRARQFNEQGFVFDMGPSWYWMPDVFESFYADFDHKPQDFYELVRLNPSYQVIVKNGESIEIPADMKGLEKLFERFEPGSSLRLRQFLKQAAFKYEVGMKELAYKPGLSLLEFADLKLLSGILKMDVFGNMRKHISKTVKHHFLQELLEFPVLFLGALPQDTPALYSLMNYADMQLGTWYPVGGMYKIIEAFKYIAEEQGVKILLQHEVTKIRTLNRRANAVETTSGIFEADFIVGSADYHHIEQMLLEPEDRQYSLSYWKSRKMAPSCLLYYIGVKKQIPKLLHHNLFFDADFNQHGNEIYRNPTWPQNPLFYVSVPSKTDSTIAPDHCENLCLLIPIAPGLDDDTDEKRDYYFNLLMDRLEKFCGSSVRENIVFKRSYSLSDFKNDYHSFKGNAYGLANTLNQTAIFKPRLKSKKVKNLYFAGQLTVPGPGIPPGIISGKVAAMQINKDELK